MSTVETLERGWYWYRQISECPSSKSFQISNSELLWIDLDYSRPDSVHSTAVKFLDSGCYITSEHLCADWVIDLKRHGTFIKAIMPTSRDL